MLRRGRDGARRPRCQRHVTRRSSYVDLARLRHRRRGRRPCDDNVPEAEFRHPCCCARRKHHHRFRGYAAGVGTVASNTMLKQCHTAILFAGDGDTRAAPHASWPASSVPSQEAAVAFVGASALASLPRSRLKLEGHESELKNKGCPGIAVHWLSAERLQPMIRRRQTQRAMAFLHQLSVRAHPLNLKRT